MDGLTVVVSGKIYKLYSAELDKYLVKHQLNTECRKSDKIKAVTLHALRSGATEIVREKKNVYSNVQESGSESDSESIIQSDCSDELDVVYKRSKYMVE